MRANFRPGSALRLALALGLGLASCMAAAQIQHVYRNVDSDGKIV